MEAHWIYLCVLGAIDFVTFIFYVVDKVKAIKDEWRVPEKVLLLLSFFGGALGGYLAMYIARHKIRKWYFHLVNILGLIWQVALFVVFYLYL